jgi:NitT/TauT family transport system substrate-binding protein
MEMPKKRIVTLVGLIVAVIVLSGFSSCLPGGSKDGSKLGRPLRVGVVTWPGYAGGIVANNGFKPNKDCIYWTKYGQTVEFLLMEDIKVRNSAFGKGGADGVDIVWSTVDFWANELPGFADGGVKARAIMQVDWSRGGDAIVADKSIQKVEDLKGKKISLALFTPSHWLLESALENSSLDESDQVEIVKNLIGKDASPDARSDFVGGKVDAAVVWEPDVSEALQKRAGSHVLVSTQTAQNLIADVMVAREDFIKEHPDVIKAFIQGWFDGTTEANRNPDRAVKVLMDNEPLYKDLGEQVTRAGLATVKWADLPDNTQMFGLDGSDPLFDRIFKQAGAAWVKRGYISRGMTPDQAKDVTFLKEIYAASPVQASTLTTVKPQVTGGNTPAPISTKPVNITFASNSSTLSAENIQVIDQIATLAITYSNSRILIEGNTDSAGSREHNIELSKQRAQAVVDYLVQHYKELDKNRFEAKGNGPDKPVKENTTETGRAANRRTDIAIVPTK